MRLSTAGCRQRAPGAEALSRRPATTGAGHPQLLPNSTIPPPSAPPLPPTDVGLHQAFKYSPDGQQLLVLGTRGTPGSDGEHLCKPTQVWQASAHAAPRLKQYLGSGSTLVQTGSTAGSARIYQAARRSAHAVEVSGPPVRRMRGVLPAGSSRPHPCPASPLNLSPVSHTPHTPQVAVTRDGGVLVSDGYCNSRVAEFGADGRWVFDYKLPARGEAQMEVPHRCAATVVGTSAGASAKQPLSRDAAAGLGGTKICWFITVFLESVQRVLCVPRGMPAKALRSLPLCAHVALPALPRLHRGAAADALPPHALPPAAWCITSAISGWWWQTASAALCTASSGPAERCWVRRAPTSVAASLAKCVAVASRGRRFCSWPSSALAAGSLALGWLQESRLALPLSVRLAAQWGRPPPASPSPLCALGQVPPPPLLSALCCHNTLGVLPPCCSAMGLAPARAG